MTLVTPFSKNVKGTPGLSLEARVPNLKPIALTILELLEFKNFKGSCTDCLELSPFNARNLRGSRDPGHAPFSKDF